MKTTATDRDIRENITITLPREVVEDLHRVASFNKTGREALIYAYIIDGLADDSLAIQRMKFTDQANESLGKSNIPPKTVEDIFDGLVY